MSSPMKCNGTKDALRVAVSMLEIIQRGGSFSTEAWFERMNAIHAAIETDKQRTMSRMERRIMRRLLPGKDVS